MLLEESVTLAMEHGLKSVAFPLIATGSFGYPKEEGMRIALDEINTFLLKQEMMIYLVVFDGDSTALGRNLYPDLQAYIDNHYVEQKCESEYLIESKGLSNAEVYKRAIISKQLFSKIKLNPDYHPDKATAMRLCIGVGLNMDETRDLLARAGYALSPCDKRDVIFSFFIEHKVFDMIEIDIALEEHGLPCFIE